LLLEFTGIENKNTPYLNGGMSALTFPLGLLQAHDPFTLHPQPLSTNHPIHHNKHYHLQLQKHEVKQAMTDHQLKREEARKFIKVRGLRRDSTINNCLPSTLCIVSLDFAISFDISTQRQVTITIYWPHRD
jgi:hypothetical protein